MPKIQVQDDDRNQANQRPPAPKAKKTTKRLPGMPGSYHDYRDGLLRWRGTIKGAPAPAQYGRSVDELKTKVQRLLNKAPDPDPEPEGEPAAIRDMLVKDVYEAWLSERRTANDSPNTIDFYEVAWKHFGPVIGERVAGDPELRGTIVRLLAKLEGRTRTTVYETAKRMFNYGVREGLKKNPLDGIPKPKVKKQHGKVRVWEREEATKVLETAKDSPWLCAIQLALLGGLRSGEIFGLKWRAVDFDKGAVRVQLILKEVNGKFYFGEPKTQASARTVRLQSVVMDALKARSKTVPSGPDDLVFADQNGGPVRRSNFRRRVFVPLVKKAGVSMRTVHEMRHTHASLLLAAGENIKVISARLGHDDIRITLSTYAHLMPNAEESTVKKLDSILGARPSKRMRAVG